MTKVYTKTGDDGTTGLIGGSRVSKFDTRIEAYGTVDELNSTIGLLNVYIDDEEDKAVIKAIQETLFVVGSHLAMDESVDAEERELPCKDEDIKMLEAEMDKMFKLVPPLKFFVLPGGCQAAAQAHVARTVCRRAERRIVELGEIVALDENLLAYVNRLSDYLFVLSRKLNILSNTQEILWKSKKV